MPRQKGKLQVNNFVAGLITDYQELNFPPNATTNEDNVDITRKGSRRRRRGIQFESGYTAVPFTPNVTQADMWTQTYEWKAVGNEGNRNFLVVQMGNVLLFFDKSVTPISDGSLPFNLDLNNFLSPTADEAGRHGISVASEKGVLYVVGEKITPFYIKYDLGTNTISTSTLALRIRDQEFLDTTDSALQPATGTITPERLYDLHNQGWDTDGIKCYDIETETVGGYTNVLDFYVSTRGEYPPKTKQWWLGKRIGDGGVTVFDPSGEYDQQFGGNTNAANGHFVVDPFDIDRSTISGIAGLERVVIDERPKAVASYAGRIWYGLKNTLYYSRVIKGDRLDLAAICHQDADPTDENIRELVASDGGVIPIPTSGDIVAMVPFESWLIVMANNGIWAVGGVGPGEGFSATGNSVSKISSDGCINPRTVFTIEGQPTWWGSEGIYLLQATPGKQGFEIQNILDKAVTEQSAIGNRTFYDEQIPHKSKWFASGAMNHLARKAVWIFDGGGADAGAPGRNRFLADRVLLYDLSYGAWNPYTISALPTDSPFVVDVFPLKGAGVTITEETVVDNLGATVTAADTSDVTINTTVYVQNVTNLGSGVKYLTLYPGVITQ